MPKSQRSCQDLPNLPRNCQEPANNNACFSCIRPTRFKKQITDRRDLNTGATACTPHDVASSIPSSFKVDKSAEALSAVENVENLTLADTTKSGPRSAWAYTTINPQRESKGCGWNYCVCSVCKPSMVGGAWGGWAVLCF